MVTGSVLIITAGFGEGHNAAARNLAEALRESHPGMRVAVHDILDDAYGWMNRLARFGYTQLINRFPSAWEFLFRRIDHHESFDRGIFIFKRAARILRNTIQHLKADVVVSTFPGYAPLMKHAFGDEDRSFSFITVITDSLTINAIWHRCPSDQFLVPNEPTAKVMEEVGIPRNKIRVTGFPTPLAFTTPDPHRETPPANGIWKVLFMVNSSPKIAPDIVRALLGIENIELTVTCGRNTKLQKKLERLAQELDKPLELHGWTPQVPELIKRSHILISKAGGATVQEALAAKTPMIITQVVPGQEEGNAQLLVSSGAGEIAITPEAIAEALKQTISPASGLYRIRQNAASQLSHPAGAKDAANLIAAICMSE